MSDRELVDPNWHPKSERALLEIEKIIDDLQESVWFPDVLEASRSIDTLRSKISDELNALAKMASVNASMCDNTVDVLGSVITNHVAWISLTREQRSGLRSLYQQACGASHDS